MRLVPWVAQAGALQRPAARGEECSRCPAASSEHRGRGSGGQRPGGDTRRWCGWRGERVKGRKPPPLTTLVWAPPMTTRQRGAPPRQQIVITAWLEHQSGAGQGKVVGGGCRGIQNAERGGGRGGARQVTGQRGRGGRAHVQGQEDSALGQRERPCGGEGHIKVCMGAVGSDRRVSRASDRSRSHLVLQLTTSHARAQVVHGRVCKKGGGGGVGGAGVECASGRYAQAHGSGSIAQEWRHPALRTLRPPPTHPQCSSAPPWWQMQSGG